MGIPKNSMSSMPIISTTSPPMNRSVNGGNGVDWTVSEDPEDDELGSLEPPDCFDSSLHSDGVTPGGDHLYWICNECTFRNDERVSTERCTLCDGKRGDTMQELMTPTFGGGDDDEVDEDSVNAVNGGSVNAVNGGNGGPMGGDAEMMKWAVDNEWFDGLAIGLGAYSERTATLEHFECALSVVVGHAPSHKAAITVLKSLRKITQRVSDQNAKYRLLDVRSEGVQSKLLGFEGSFEFLQFLGYALDRSQTQLQCLKHPPQSLLDEVIAVIDGLLATQREKVQIRKNRKRSAKLRRRERVSSVHSEHGADGDGSGDGSGDGHGDGKGNDGGSGGAQMGGAQMGGAQMGGAQMGGMDGAVMASQSHSEWHRQSECGSKSGSGSDDSSSAVLMKWDGGDFTLAQLVGLVTHEALNDEDAVKVLLLCHRCFSSSMELLEAVRKRFFVPAPDSASSWSEEEVICWCQSIQRPIQRKCIEIMCQWISSYFRADFVSQPDVLSKLHEFKEQVIDCKSECTDGWYDSMYTLMQSAEESAHRVLDREYHHHHHGVGHRHGNGDDDKEEENESGSSAESKGDRVRVGVAVGDHDHDDDEKVAAVSASSKEVDLVALSKALYLNYGLIPMDSKKRKRVKLWPKGKSKNKGPSSWMEDTEMIERISARSMAEQLTVWDSECFGMVSSREFLEKVWRSNGGGVGDRHSASNRFPNLSAMIGRFNAVHRFVTLCIVSCGELPHRVRTLAHFVEVSCHCLELRNFFCLMAVFSALDSIAVSKLKYCWLRLDAKHKAMRSKLAAVCDPNHNFKALRNRMHSAFMEREAAIPYIGLFLSDLTFVNDGAAKLVEGFINFKRFERFTERCKIVESFQSISYRHKLQKTDLAPALRHDLATFNLAVNDHALKLLVQSAVSNDEKRASPKERHTLKALRAQNRRHRRHQRAHRQKHKKPAVFGRFIK